MIDCFYFVAKRRNVLFGHILNDYQREGAFAEILEQLVLTDDRVDIGRQVVEHIIVDPCAEHSEYRRYHKNESKDQDRNAVFYDRS